MAEQWKIGKNEVKTKNNVSIPYDRLQQKHVRCVCKIETQHGDVESGTGFLCKIPIGDYNLYGIMTCKHVVKNLTYPCDLQHCTASFQYAQPPVTVRLDKVFHTIIAMASTNMDAIFLVPKKQWIIENKMLCTEELHEENLLIYEAGMEFYASHYEGGEQLLLGAGTTGEMRDGNIIAHDMTTDEGSSGTPLIWKRTDMVIAMHLGGIDNPVEPFLSGVVKIIPVVNDIRRRYNSVAFLKNNAYKHSFLWKTLQF